MLLEEHTCVSVIWSEIDVCAESDCVIGVVSGCYRQREKIGRASMRIRAQQHDDQVTQNASGCDV